MSGVRSVRLHGQPDRPVEYPIDDVKRHALHEQAVLISEVVDAFAENIVLGDDLFDVEGVLYALLTMSQRTTRFERFGDRFVGAFGERRGQLID